jgi:glycosyltransferase involved in cell wall biosynthesis
MDEQRGSSLPFCEEGKLRVLHLITSLHVGGAEAMLEKLAMSMAPDRFETMVVVLTDLGTIAQRMLRAGASVTSLGMKRGGADASALLRLVILLRRFRPHILQTWLYHADLLGTVAARLARVPHLTWNIRCSDMDLSKYPRMTKWVVQALARLSPVPDLIVANSEAGRVAHTMLGYRPKRWEVIPNGFDLHRFKPDSQNRSAFRASLHIDSDTFLVGLPARVDPMKDHATFLAAARGVLDAGHKARFVLIGRGADLRNPEIGDAVTRLGLAAAVYALGEQSDMSRILPGLDLVVLSSAFGEGFPNVLGEAMAVGVPCIATNVGDAAMIVGDTGRIVPPGDPNALAQAMAKLASMPESERAALGRSARTRIECSFSIERVTARYEALYQALADSRTALRKLNRGRVIDRA